MTLVLFGQWAFVMFASGFVIGWLIQAMKESASAIVN